MKWGMRIWHLARDPTGNVNSSPNINTDPTFPVPSPYYVLFSPDILSQQEYRFMADINAIAKCEYRPSRAMTVGNATKASPLQYSTYSNPRTQGITLSHKPRDTPAASITVSQLAKPPHPVTSTSSSGLPSPFPPTAQSPHFRAAQAGNRSQQGDLHRKKGRS